MTEAERNARAYTLEVLARRELLAGHLERAVLQQRRADELRQCKVGRAER